VEGAPAKLPKIVFSSNSRKQEKHQRKVLSLVLINNILSGYVQERVISLDNKNVIPVEKWGYLLRWIVFPITCATGLRKFAPDTKTCAILCGISNCWLVTRFWTHPESSKARDHQEFHNWKPLVFQEENKFLDTE